MRAETAALMSASMFAVSAGLEFYLWSDCQVVVERAVAIQKLEFKVTSRIADHDLWLVIQDALAGNELCQIRKVDSHQDRFLTGWDGFLTAMIRQTSQALIAQVSSRESPPVVSQCFQTSQDDSAS